MDGRINGRWDIQKTYLSRWTEWDGMGEEERKWKEMRGSSKEGSQVTILIDITIYEPTTST